MAAQSLSKRLQALTDSYKSTLTLIQRLQKLPSTPGTYGSSEGDPRLELSSEIHQSLKDREDELETLKQDMEDTDTLYSGDYGSVGGIRRRPSEQVNEKERITAAVVRLGEDLKTARSSFRKAQLSAKRNADTARRKERDLLFANRGQLTDDGPRAAAPSRRKGQEKLTPEELAQNAESDVTAALRRTHTLLQSNVEQSQFAQQTLDESGEALASLGQGYAGIDSLLKNSGGLVRSLMRSNKSDTWYLTTAFYILVVTLAWLVFRRILYGPLWWLVWQPLKLGWWVLTMMLTSVGILGGRNAGAGLTAASGSLAQSVTGSVAASRPTWPSGRGGGYVPVGAKGGGWGVQRPRETPKAKKNAEEEKTLVEEIGEMTKQNDAQYDEQEEETKLRERTAEDGPPNPKKRMFEQSVEASGHKKDEL